MTDQGDTNADAERSGAARGRSGKAEDRTEYAEDRTEYAETRTDYAEDRTAMANERTFAGWMRTGLAGVGVGLAFNALFVQLEPAWLPKAIASTFVLAAIFVFYVAQRHACQVNERLTAHKAEPLDGMNMGLVAAVLVMASLALLVSIWLLDWD